jgi:hypothetical protein
MGAVDHFLQMIPSGFPSPDSLRQRFVGSYTLNEDMCKFIVDGATSLAKVWTMIGWTTNFQQYEISMITKAL